MAPSKIALFLQEWAKQPEPRTLEELEELFERVFPGVDFRPYLESAIEIGSVEVGGDGQFILTRREAIVRDICFTVDRYCRLTHELVRTMRGNIDGIRRIERTSVVVGLAEEDLEGFRQFAEERLGQCLREIDDYLVRRQREGGIPAGVSVFQFDGQ